MNSVTVARTVPMMIPPSQTMADSSLLCAYTRGEELGVTTGTVETYACVSGVCTVKVENIYIHMKNIHIHM